ncbi:ATP-binding protein [bacterium]|jgi:uncharacterized protein|nr:ATP-binding protein [bacterium]MBT4552321.1 ATP-binding protein [bacterium]MBT5988292.1 ATP-binding protein [bacterium]
MFNRSILKQLQVWADNPDRKPLVLRGARQVGKTTTVEMFSKNFDTYIYLNLENIDDKKIFEQNLNIKNLISSIFLYKQKEKKGRCLIFIDEIQYSSEAIKMLRYFFEDAKELFVIAAGSLLETLLDNKTSFPVGRVEYLFMHPLTFQEFLAATNNSKALEVYNTVPFPDYAHTTLLNLFHKYTLLGGMPEVIKKHIKDPEDIVSLNSIYNNLLTSYLDDVEKYAKNQTMVNVIRHVIHQAPYESGKRIKFQGFGNSNYKSREIGEALRTLEKTMLTKLIYPSTSASLPIISDYKKSPKLQFLDTGFINYLAGLQQAYYSLSDLNAIYKGLIAEHIVGQELIFLDLSLNRSLNFWVREKRQSSAEVDFIIPYKNYIIPIEVKAGATGTLKSLHQFIEETKVPYAIRLYAGTVKLDKTKTIQGTPFTLINLPYFLTSKIKEYLNFYIK